MTTTPALTKSQANQFIKERGILLPNNQVMLSEPIFVFKKVRTETGSGYHKTRHQVIANLVIPTGAVVNLAQDSDKKMRANQAYCYNLVDANSEVEYDTAVSTYTYAFTYHSGKKHGLKLKDVQKLVLNHELYARGLRARFSQSWEPDTPTEKRIKALTKCKVVPTNGFSSATNTCVPGIHFFIELEKAKRY